MYKIYRGFCPGGANDDVKCCVISKDAGGDNKELKKSYYHAAAAGAVIGDESGPSMDWGYDDVAETASAPRYEGGSEAEKLRFPAQDTSLVDNMAEGDWRVQG